MKQVEIFNDYKPARISKELYEIDKCRWRLSVPASRLLFALSQIVSEDKGNDLFPELGFRIDILFKYLGLTKNNDRYNRLDDALNEIMSKNLHIISNTRKGGTQWLGIAWIEKYEFSTDEPLVKIIVTNSAKPFLRQLTQYARIQPKIYLKLSSEYQNWFYPYFKQFEKLGKWKVSIEDLKQALMLEDVDSYNPQKDKRATNYFLSSVLGIELSESAKKENMLSKKEKRQAKPIPWDYVKNTKGEYTGTLFHITEKTDLNVTASCMKTGRSYTHIIFFISQKKISNYKQKKHTDSNTGADLDFQKPVKRKAKTQKDMQDIFASEFDARKFISNPAYEKELPKRIVFYSEEQLSGMAKETAKTVQEVAKMMRLELGEDGRYYREY